jgi:hypothetical protein
MIMPAGCVPISCWLKSGNAGDSQVAGLSRKAQAGKGSDTWVAAVAASAQARASGIRIRAPCALAAVNEAGLSAAVETATTLGNARLRAYALLGLGGALAQRSAAEAGQRLGDAVEAFRATGDAWGLAMTLSTCGQLAPLDPLAAPGAGMAGAEVVGQSPGSVKAEHVQDLRPQIVVVYRLGGGQSLLVHRAAAHRPCGGGATGVRASLPWR